MTGDVSRRRLLAASTAGAAGLVTWSLLGSGASAAGRGPAARLIPLDTGWLFGEAADGATAPGFDDSGLSPVTLPHTVTRLSWQRWDPARWERSWIYRNRFDRPGGLGGMRVFLDVDAALTEALPTLNGRELPAHIGGYLPFRREVTDLLRPRGNVLAVLLDSRFNLNVPPNRPAPAKSTATDFWQPGGLYRGVRLRAVPRIFLADVHARPAAVLDAADRRVDVTCTVDAAVVPDAGVRITTELLDGGRVLAAATAPVTVTAPGEAAATATLTGLDGVTLWDLDRPKLYRVRATLHIGGEAVHDHTVRIGFRDAVFRTDGFHLNGRRVQLFGVNRHQFYPFAGGAMADRVQARDAEILRRELNCTMVRCSHYPQSEAFLDACDELGLLAWEEAPGWGYLGDDAWKARAVRDVGDMVRRDRNHPSVIIWGSRLNETDDDVPLYTKTRDLAHSLDGSRPTCGAMAGRHDTPDYVEEVFTQNDYSSSTGPDGRRQPELMPPRTDRPYLVSESVGTLSGPVRFYRRIDSQPDQQGQATAHARVHELAYADERYCGMLAWAGFDYPSGSGNQYQGVKYVGVVDLFREPKPGAAIYQAQVDPSERAVIRPAFCWDFGPGSPVSGLERAMICANLDRLEVYVGGRHHATLEPDTGEYGHLPYPPSFADFSGVDDAGRPELRIDGYLGDTKVASRRFSADPSHDRLALAADDAVLTADGRDATRVAFRAVDRYGAPRPYPAGDVELSVSGPAVLVGDNPFAFAETGGVGAVWLRTLPGSPGTVTVRAEHPTLGGASATVKVRRHPAAGPPPPFGNLSVTADPPLLAPAGTATVTAVFTVNGLPTLDRLTLTPHAPDGWTLDPASPASFTGVRSGQRVRAEWRVTAPAGAPGGAAELSVAAGYTAGKQRGETDAGATLIVPYASLDAARDNTGTSDDADVSTGDLDGVGNSYSRQALAAAGLTPGGDVRHDGLTFRWPDAVAGRPDNVLADGRTIAFTGSGTRLGFLGSSSRGNNGGPGTVHYADGSSSTFRLVLADYFSPAPPGLGNDAVAAMTYCNTASGRGNGGVPGQRQQDVYVFHAAVPVTPGKQIAGVTLPAVSGSVEGGGPALHVFAMAVG